LAPDQWRTVVHGLVTAGHSVVVTGNAVEAPGVERIAARHAGPVATLASDDFDVLAGVIEHARAIVVGNTGAAHVAAAVGTPVVSCFAPTVPASRWRPWGVPFVLLGAQDMECAGCRARICPREHQSCLADVGTEHVLAALDVLARADTRAVPA
jgi:ADP-heptose:LPS heptosyltransferase